MSRGQQLQDHDLHRHVKRGGRLVEHQEIGLDRDRAGDADAGALAARELMRKAVQQFERQAAAARRLFDLAAQLGAGELAQPAQRIGDCGERGEARVDAVARVLEHHLDALAVRVARQSACAGVCESSRGPSLMPPSVGSSSRVTHAHQRGLAAAGFADEADGLALADGEAHVVDRVDQRQLFRSAGEALAQPRDWAGRPAGRKALGEFGDVEQRGRHSGFQQATMMRIVRRPERAADVRRSTSLRGQRSE